MKKKLLVWLVAALVLGQVMSFFLSQFILNPSASGYRISDYKGVLTLFEDNTAHYEQDLTYIYSESFNGQYVTLGQVGQLPPGFDIRADEVEYSVYVNGNLRSYRQKGQDSVGQWSNNTVEYMGDGYRLKIYNGVHPGDEVRIQVKWPLENMLFPYEDIAELHWIPISDWDVALENVDLTVQLDQPDQTLESQLFAHTGYLNPEPQVESDGVTYRIQLDHLAAGKDLELHAYWEKEILRGLAPEDQLSGQVKDHFLKTEANISRYNKLVASLVYLYLPVGALVLALLEFGFFRAYRQKLDKSQTMIRDARLYEPPTDWAPMVVAAKIFNVKPDDLSPLYKNNSRFTFEQVVQATILDLIDRGNLIVESPGKNPVLTIISRSGLSEAETYLLAMAFGSHKSRRMKNLFESLSSANQIIQGTSKTKRKDVADINRRGDELLEKFRKTFIQLTDSLTEDMRKLALPTYYRDLNAGERFLLGFPGLGILFLGLGSFVFHFYLLVNFGVSAWTLLSIFAVSLVIFLSFVKEKASYFNYGVLTDDGLEVYYHWHSFENMLREIGRFEKTELEAIVLWNRILVYATLFGYAEEVSRVLEMHDISIPNPYLNTYARQHYFTVLDQRTGGLRSDVQAAREASNFSLPSESSMSSGGGGGGGFSSGGFSGGGGGGGGGSF